MTNTSEQKVSEPEVNPAEVQEQEGFKTPEVDPDGEWSGLFDDIHDLAKLRAQDAQNLESMFRSLSPEESESLGLSERRSKRLASYLLSAERNLAGINNHVGDASYFASEKAKSGSFWLGASGAIGTVSNAGGMFKYFGQFAESPAWDSGFGALGFFGYTAQNAVDFALNFMPSSSVPIQVSDDMREGLEKNLPEGLQYRREWADKAANVGSKLKANQFMISRVMVLGATAATLAAHALETFAYGKPQEAAFYGRAAALGGVLLKMHQGNKAGVGSTVVQGGLLSSGGTGLIVSGAQSGEVEQMLVGGGIVINWLMWAGAQFLGDDSKTPVSDKKIDSLNRMVLHSLSSIKSLEGADGAEPEIHREAIVDDIRRAAKVLAMRSLHEAKSEDEIAYGLAAVVDEHHPLGLTEKEFRKIPIYGRNHCMEFGSDIHKAIAVIEPKEVVYAPAITGNLTVMNFESEEQIPMSLRNGTLTITIGDNQLKELGRRMERAQVSDISVSA